jgi:hypothetical protein
MDTLSPQQLKRYNKAIYTDPLYLLDLKYDETESTIHWSIAGATRNIYNVTLKQPHCWCDCPDMKTRDTVCKHVVFALWKVCKYRNWTYFSTKIIQPADFEELVNVALERDQIMHDKTIVDDDLVSRFNRITVSKPTTPLSIMEEPEARPYTDTDECPICYDALTAKSTDACSTCKNSVHVECLARWLQFNQTCAYCRTRWQSINQAAIFYQANNPPPAYQRL